MIYTVLLRGINVGGKNVVKMADLERLLINLGFLEVKTYIQSGNAIFEADLDEATVTGKIKSGFFECFGFESNALVRNIHEMQSVLEQLPFTDSEIVQAEAVNPETEHLYVYFLDESPEQVLIDAIYGNYSGADKLRAGNQELYFLCQQSIRNSKLAASVSKKFPSATARNWKTVKKLNGMMTD